MGEIIQSTISPTVYYRFESGALTTDTASGGHTLTGIGDPAETTGKFGGGVALDGNDGYSATDHADFKPTTSFTVGAWFRTSTTGAYQLIFSSYSQNTNVAGIEFRIDTTNKLFLISGKNSGTTGGTDFHTVGSLNTVTNGDWHFGVGTWDGATLKIYVDGFQEGAGTAWANAPAYAATNYVRVGCRKYNASAESLFFTGQLDEVFLINGTALDQQQVLNLYNSAIKSINGTQTQAHEIYNDVLYSDANLQGYWRLESDGTDSSANGYNLTGTTRGAVLGRFGNGLDFEVGNSDYLTLADASCPNLEISGSQTWSCWVKLESIAGGNPGLIDKYSGSTRKGLHHENGGNFRFDLTGLTTNSYVYGTIPAVIGKWYHVAGVYDSSASKLKIFVNGIKDEVSASGSATDSNSAFFMGKNGTASYYIDGVMDDAAVWNRALTDAEVLRLYNGNIKHVNGVTIGNTEITETKLYSDANLQGYWRLEADGTDSGPNGYTVAPGNAPEGYVAAKFGNGADFERGNSDYLTLADASCTNLEISGSQTWSLWFKPESLPSGFQYLTAKTNSGVTVYKGLAVTTNYPYFVILGLTTNNAVTSSVAMISGNWYHICGIYDSTEAKLKIFVNGVKNEAIASGSGTDTNSSFSIGRGGDYNGHYVDGIIDDVAIWNRALTDTEVLSLYKGTLKSYNGLY